MENKTIEQNALYEKMTDLNQKLFFHPTKTTPTENNPVTQDCWSEFVECYKRANLLIGDDKYKIVTLLVTKNNSSTKSYYLETLLAGQNYDQRVNEVGKIGRTVIHTVRLV